MNEPISLIIAPGGKVHGVYVGDPEGAVVAQRFYYAEDGTQPIPGALLDYRKDYPPHLCRALSTGLETR